MKIHLAQTGQDFAQAAEMFREYQDWLGEAVCFSGFAQELADLPRLYSPPLGALVLLQAGEMTLGCGGLCQVEPGLGELKRIFVKASHRGQGQGRAITLALLEQARALGMSRVRLHSLKRLQPALRLYESLGFVPCPPFVKAGAEEVFYQLDGVSPQP